MNKLEQLEKAYKKERFSMGVCIPSKSKCVARQLWPDFITFDYEKEEYMQQRLNQRWRPPAFVGINLTLEVFFMRRFFYR